MFAGPRWLARSAGPRLLLTLLVFVMLVFVMAGGAAGAATAVAPAQEVNPVAPVPFAGHLADASGAPVADGLYRFSFALFAQQSGGEPLWRETLDGVPVGGGAFAVELGAGSPLPAGIATPLWLEIGVQGPAESAMTILAPRERFFAKDLPAAEAAVQPAAADALSCAHTHWAENWSGSNAAYGLRVFNSSTGDGLRAYTYSADPLYGGVYGAALGSGPGSGVYGKATSGSGVLGASLSGAGVRGESGASDGVVGSASAALKSGVYGVSTGGGYGVFGRSSAWFGLGADGSGDGSGVDTLGDLLLGGARGEIFAAGSLLNLYSQGSINVDLDNDNNESNACLRLWNGADAVAAQWCENGTKSAVIQTQESGGRAVYTIESPEVWLEDFGSATLVNGEATVLFDLVFLQMINTGVDYHVFLTPVGAPADLYVAEKRADGFVVRAQDTGTQTLTVDWRVAAKRSGLEDVRAEVVAASGDQR